MKNVKRCFHQSFQFDEAVVTFYLIDVAVSNIRLLQRCAKALPRIK